MAAKWGEAQAYFEQTLAEADRGPCWLWPYGGRTHGYGQIHVAEMKTVRAVHFHAWETEYGGRLPEGYQLVHEMPKGSVRPAWPRCWNPSHRFPAPTRKTRFRKLSPEQVQAMVDRYLAGERAEDLAAEFDISPGLLYRRARERRAAV